METLLITLVGVAVAAAVAAALVLSGWQPRLAGRAVYVIESIMETGSQLSKLSPRDRAELVARLWVPW